MQTFEEFLEDMRKVIPACEFDENELYGVWEDMVRYEQYDTVGDYEEDDIEPLHEATEGGEEALQWLKNELSK